MAPEVRERVAKLLLQNGVSWGSRSMVEQPTHDSKFENLNPDTFGTGKEKINKKISEWCWPVTVE
jgi:hypothetical protein